MKFQLHRDTGRSHPAFNVKCYNVPADPKHTSLAQIPEDQLESMRQRAYEVAQANFWLDADMAAIECGFTGCYSEGRMGGWLAPYYGKSGYADPEEDAAALDKLGDLLDAAIETAKADYLGYLTEELDAWHVEPVECFTLDSMGCPIKLGQQGPDNFTVTYGKQVDSNLTYGDACSKLGQAILHALACAGKIDNS